MRGMRVKKLRAVYLSLVDKKMAPPDDRKRHFRFFKKLYMRGVLDTFLPSI